MSRVVRFYELGGPDVLKVEDVDVPPPREGEVQIRTKAFGLFFQYGALDTSDVPVPVMRCSQRT